MDNFEKHIRENATKFDTHKADRAKMWANISAEIQKKEPKVIPLWKRPMLRIAASVVLVLGISAIIGLYQFGASSADTQYASRELLEIDMYYQDLVSYQVQLVKNNPNITEENKEEFLSFMDDLDAEYDVLRKEMRKNLDNERVLEAIIANYKKRIELIENLLHQLNESKKPNDDYGYTL